MPRVLYVEDDAVLQLDGEACLTAAGYDVAAASGGQEACDYLCRYGADLDILITDIDLAGGLNGWCVAELGRDITRALAVVYVTGDAGGDFEARAVARGLLFRKPFEWDRLISSLPALARAVS